MPEDRIPVRRFAVTVLFEDRIKLTETRSEISLSLTSISGEPSAYPRPRNERPDVSANLPNPRLRTTLPLKSASPSATVSINGRKAVWAFPSMEASMTESAPALRISAYPERSRTTCSPAPILSSAPFQTTKGAAIVTVFPLFPMRPSGTLSDAEATRSDRV